MHGAGNDFIVVQSDNEQNGWHKMATSVCDRHFGIGADGVLVMLPSKTADFKMRIFNADGTESEACGNGMRCLVEFYLERHGVSAPESEITIETASGMRKARVRKRSGQTTEILAGMGQPGIGRDGTSVKLDERTRDEFIQQMNQTIEVAGHKLSLRLVSIGNPHAVYFTETPVREYPLSTIGPLVESHPLFPYKTNYEVARVVNRGEAEARVWERGCGETLACGSGACAIGVAGIILGYFDNEVKISLPGGILTVAWDRVGEVYLSGPVETVFKGEWPY